MPSANFSLREWDSSSSKIRTLTKEENAQDESTETKLLGHRWNSYTDILELQEKRPPSDPKKNLRVLK